MPSGYFSPFDGASPAGLRRRAADGPPLRVFDADAGHVEVEPVSLVQP